MSANEAWKALVKQNVKYLHVDPDQVNPAEWARDMGGEVTHNAEIRLVNAASNEKSEENTLIMDQLNVPETVFWTNASGLEGNWKVVGQHKVQGAEVLYQCVKCTEEGEALDPTIVWVSASRIGVATNAENMFEQVAARQVKRGVWGKAAAALKTKVS